MNDIRQTFDQYMALIAGDDDLRNYLESIPVTASVTGENIEYPTTLLTTVEFANFMNLHNHWTSDSDPVGIMTQCIANVEKAISQRSN